MKKQILTLALAAAMTASLAVSVSAEDEFAADFPYEISDSFYYFNEREGMVGKYYLMIQSTAESGYDGVLDMTTGEINLLQDFTIYALIDDWVFASRAEDYTFTDKNSGSVQTEQRNVFYIVNVKTGEERPVTYTPNNSSYLGADELPREDGTLQFSREIGGMYGDSFIACRGVFVSSDRIYTVEGTELVLPEETKQAMGSNRVTFSPYGTYGIVMEVSAVINNEERWLGTYELDEKGNIVYAERPDGIIDRTADLFQKPSKPGYTFIDWTPELREFFLDYGYNFFWGANFSEEDVTAYILDDHGKFRVAIDKKDAESTPVTPDIPAAPTFTDVPADAYYAAPVSWAFTNGITKGTNDTTFAPDEVCTRAHILTFLWRTAGCPEASAKMTFTDVVESEYYAPAVRWAIEKGIIEAGESFAPNTACTRGDIVDFMWKYAGSPASETVPKFTDVTADSADYNAVAWATDAGITDGMTETTFSADESYKRGEVITFIWKAFSK